MLSLEGNIVNIDGQLRALVEIGDDGLISKVTSPTGQADFVFKDELIFPGFIDIHVHARECQDHLQDYKEDFFTAGQAAINGGVVAFADMPNNTIPPVDEKSYTEKFELTKKCAIDVLLYAGIGPKTKPITNLSPSIKDIGIKSSLVPYKVFMGKSVGDLFFESFDNLDSVLSDYKGQNVSFHCEDPKILKQNDQQLLHELKRPKEAEISAVLFALKMIEKYQLNGKICHCSTMEALQKIIEAKNVGLSVTVEVTPHHLYFDQTMINDENRKMFQVNPPLRQSKENRLKLIEALKNGDIDFLATDHAPHTLLEKAQGISGMPHLDTYGPFVSWLIKDHGFKPEDIARVCSFNPGTFINKFTTKKYGRIEEGYLGSFTVLDTNSPIKINKSMLKTKCGWSPFEDIVFPGSVVKTVIKGKIYS